MYIKTQKGTPASGVYVRRNVADEMLTLLSTNEIILLHESLLLAFGEDGSWTFCTCVGGRIKNSATRRTY